MNFIPGKVVQILKDSGAVYVRAEFKEKILCQTDSLDAMTPGKTVYVSIRPEDVEVLMQPTLASQNLLKGTIVHKAYLGNFLYFFVRVNGTMIRVQVPHHLPQEEGQEIFLSFNPQKCVILS